MVCGGVYPGLFDVGLENGGKGNGDENLAKNETGDGTCEKFRITTAGHKVDGMSLALLQVNCRSIIINY